MNRNRVLVTGIVVFVAYMVMAIIVHGLWLGPIYSSLAGNVWREGIWYGFVAYFFVGFQARFFTPTPPTRSRST